MGQLGGAVTVITTGNLELQVARFCVVTEQPIVAFSARMDKDCSLSDQRRRRKSPHRRLTIRVFAEILLPSDVTRQWIQTLQQTTCPEGVQVSLVQRGRGAGTSTSD